MKDWSLIHGEMLEVLGGMEPCSVDAIVTDPPYGLGFMGKQWDDLPPGDAAASAMLRVLKPGGHVVAFGGTRTYHRLACALEDAGFEIRDSLMWIYGSGFPKSLDVSKAIDKAAGAEREVVGKQTKARAKGSASALPTMGAETEYKSWDVTAPATPEAEQWEGWGTALKPAQEPIVLARKPLDGTVAANTQQHGTGALNVDGCRVGTEKIRTTGHTGDKYAKFRGGEQGASVDFGEHAGRWPPNVLLTHGACCGEECGATERSTCVADDDESFARGVGSALLGSGFRGFLADCPTCLRSCGGSLRELSTLCADASPSPERVLSVAGRLATSLERSLENRNYDLPSSSDGFLSDENRSSIQENRSVHELHRAYEPGNLLRTDRTVSSEPSDSDARGNTPSSNMVSCGDNGEIRNHSDCRHEASRLVWLLAGSMLSGSWGHYSSLCPVAEMDRQSGESTIPATVTRGPSRGTPADYTPHKWGVQQHPCHGDSVGASRFFPRFRYVAKASTGERNAGLDSFEIVLVEWSTWDGEDRRVRLRVDMERSRPRVTAVSGAQNSDATEWSMFLFGSGSTALSRMDSKSITVTGSRSITASKTLNSLARLFTSADIAVANGDPVSGGSHAGSAETGIPLLTITSVETVSPLGAGPAVSATQLRISGNAGSPADHPTVKPVALMRWLVRLVTPPGGTVLDPFAGSGTTLMAALQEGFACIGVEREGEYIDLARRRVEEDSPLFNRECVRR